MSSQLLLRLIAQAAPASNSYDCSTRSFPSPAVDDSFLETVDSRRKALYRAFKFTKAICNDIEAANHAGITRMVDPVRPRTHP
jgi:hypothetical protein